MSVPTARPTGTRPTRTPARLAGAALTLLGLLAGSACAEPALLPALTASPAPGGGQTYSLSVQTLLFFSALSFLPAVLLMMTAFTRIVILLSLLRHALGLQARGGTHG